MNKNDPIINITSASVVIFGLLSIFLSGLVYNKTNSISLTISTVITGIIFVFLGYKIFYKKRWAIITLIVFCSVEMIGRIYAMIAESTIGHIPILLTGILILLIMSLKKIKK